MDTDTRVLAPVPELFCAHASGEAAVGARAGSILLVSTIAPVASLNGGLQILRPNALLFEEMRREIRRSNYTHAAGWEGFGHAPPRRIGKTERPSNAQSRCAAGRDFFFCMSFIW